MGTFNTIRSGATAMAEDSFLQDLTDLLLAGGVKDMGSSNHLKVAQRGAGANMSVDVGMGRCFIKGTSSNAYPVRHTSSVTNIAVTSNSSGSGRKDAVVLYIDLAETPDSTASDVPKLMVVAGTPAGSPVAPTDGAIQTAVGASNPFLRLADIQVDNGETMIQTADITDKRVPFQVRATYMSPQTYTPSAAATATLDLALSNIHEITMPAGNITIAISNAAIGQYFTVDITQDSVGSRTVTWFSTIRWAGGSAPVLTTTANKRDSFIFKVTGIGTYDGFVPGVSI